MRGYILGKRTLVISDIHGCYLEFMELLEKAKYIPEEDKLIVLGDLIDRGKGSKQVVTYLMEMKKLYDIVVLKGNHEKDFSNWLDEPFSRDHRYLKNGGWKTIESYCKPRGVYGKHPRTKATIRTFYPEDIEFIKNLPLFWEDDKHLYVHAGINLDLKNWKDTSDEDFLWIREAFHYTLNNTGKTVIFGHTPTHYLHKKEGKNSYDVWFSSDNKIGIDGGCSMGGELHCLIIKDDSYYVETVNSK